MNEMSLLFQIFLFSFLFQRAASDVALPNSQRWIEYCRAITWTAQRHFAPKWAALSPPLVDGLRLPRCMAAGCSPSDDK